MREVDIAIGRGVATRRINRHKDTKESGEFQFDSFGSGTLVYKHNILDADFSGGFMRNAWILLTGLLISCASVNQEQSSEQTPLTSHVEYFGYDEIPEKPVIIISELQSSGLNLSDTESISNYINNSYKEIDRYSIVKRDSLDTVIEEINLQLSGMTAEEGAVKVGQLMNAQKVVLASVSRSGAISLSESEEQYLLNIETVDIETAKVEVSFTNMCSGISGVYTSIDDHILEISSNTPVYGTILNIDESKLIVLFNGRIDLDEDGLVSIEAVVEQIEDEEGRVVYVKSAKIANARILGNQDGTYELEVLDNVGSYLEDGFIIRSQ